MLYNYKKKLHDSHGETDKPDDQVDMPFKVEKAAV
jgi:hypothetical protein